MNALFQTWATAHRYREGEPLADRSWRMRQGQPVDAYTKRRDATKRYAWAVPTDEALEAIARYSPVVEIGAGTGYWAHLLRERGVDIIALDMAPPSRHKNHFHDESPTWTEVQVGLAGDARHYPDRALLLCWPPYDDPMALEAARAHAEMGGTTLIYVGEGGGGCTADDAFHTLLETDYEEIESVEIPQWDGLHDRLTVYRRTPPTEGKD